MHHEDLNTLVAAAAAAVRACTITTRTSHHESFTVSGTGFNGILRKEIARQNAIIEEALRKKAAAEVG